MPIPDFIKAFRSHPLVAALHTATDFPVSATVEGDLSQHDAGYQYAASGQLQGRWFRAVRARDARVLWLFEIDEDAVQFACKFGGQPSRCVVVSDWQGHRQNDG